MFVAGVYIIVVMGLSSVSVIFAVIVSNMHHQSFMDRDLPCWLRKVAAVLNKLIKVSPRKRLKCTVPSKKEMAPDLKTPLRESYSSVNLTFRNDAELFDLTYANEHINVAKNKKTKEGESGGKSKNTSNHKCNDHGIETAIVTHAHSNANYTANHVKHSLSNDRLPHDRPHDSISNDRLARDRSHDAIPKHAHSNDKLNREPSLSKRKGTNDTPQNEQICRHLSLLLMRQEDLLKSQIKNGVNKEWQEVAEICDRFLFWCTFVVMFTVTIVILLFVPLGKSVDM